MASRVAIKLVRSGAHGTATIQGTLKSLNLTKVNKVAVHPIQPTILGKINAVKHYVDVREIHNDGSADDVWTD